jgi:rod shape determining protein RodA
MERTQKYLKNIDWILVFAVLCVTIIGLVFVYSATNNMPNFLKLFSKQLISVVVGFGMLFLFSVVDYNSYYKLAKYFYVFAIFLLISVLVFGKTVRGTKSWFDFGFFSFQPTELARLFTVVMVSVYLDRNIRNIKSFFVFVKGLLIILPVIFLIFLQPDFGGILVFFPVIFGMFYVAGVSKIYLHSIFFSVFWIVFVPLFRTFFVMYNANFLQYLNFFYLLSAGILVFIGIYFLLKFLKIHFNKSVFIYFGVLFVLCLGIGELCDQHIKDYQRNRLMVFFSPEADKLGAGYNVIQSKIAVGSGGFWGKGIKAGTQVQLGFLPERHTDFIFSVVGEEGGFFISVIVLLLFGLICYRIYLASENSRDRFGSIISTGFLILFSFFVFLNIGFVVGLLPVTGVPLPFVSYGGSSFIINCMVMGIILNIGIKRYAN